MKSKRNYTLTVDGKRVETHRFQPFYTHVRSINWRKLNGSVTLRISYGVGQDYKGRVVTFFNEIETNNKQEFLQAFRAFTEL
jgi:hypothetical protein